MMPTIKPTELYLTLSSERFKGMEGPSICEPGYELQGNVRVFQWLNQVRYLKIEKEIYYMLDIEPKGETTFTVDDVAARYEYVFDENGDGIKNGKDSGYFETLQKFLAEVKAFTDNPQNVLRCVKKFQGFQ